MARSKPGALEALRKLHEEQERLAAKEAQLKADAAGELGTMLVECGAEMLDGAKLRRLVRRSLELGIDSALERLAAVK